MAPFKGCKLIKWDLPLWVERQGLSELTDWRPPYSFNCLMRSIIVVTSLTSLLIPSSTLGNALLTFCHKSCILAIHIQVFPTTLVILSAFILYDNGNDALSVRLVILFISRKNERETTIMPVSCESAHCRSITYERPWFDFEVTELYQFRIIKITIACTHIVCE